MIMVAKTRDFLEVTASPANSGYYCCSVTYNMEVVSRHCVTVWIRGIVYHVVMKCMYCNTDVYIHTCRESHIHTSTYT